MHLPEFIKIADTAIFLAINGLHNDTADFLFYWSAQKFTWIPFYICLLFIVWKSSGKKTGWILLFTGLLIASTDQISTGMKNGTFRLRPCHEPALKEKVHLVRNACGGKYGFVSSHAANTMALAVFLWLLLKEDRKILRWLLPLYIFLNGYSRIYLGAHYPLDVLGGWILGIVAAILAYRLYSKKTEGAQT